VRNEEVLHRVKEERNIVHTIKRRKANWFGDSRDSRKVIGKDGNDGKTRKKV
jgi:hypothetical protein